MFARNGIWVIAGIWAMAGFALGQGQVPVAPLLPTAPQAGQPTYPVAPAPLMPNQPQVILGAPTAPVIYAPPAQQPPPAPLFVPADPGRDGWGPYGLPSNLPTLFFGLDLLFVQPSVTGSLTGNMPLPGGGSQTFTTPHTSLNFTVSPRFELGWRLPDSQGEFAISYRFLNADGSANIDSVFGPLQNKTGLSTQIFDFDYITARYSPLPRYNLRWRLGARLATVYYNNQASNAVFAENASNYFIGAGPHAGVELEREINLIPGLAVFGKVDGAVAVGQVQQKFSETLAGITTTFPQTRTQSSPSLTVQLGLSYHPPRMEYLRFMAGFQYERFWEVGKVSGSTGDVQDYGGFIGGILDF